MVILKVKVKLSLCLTSYYAMETYWGIGVIEPRILNLCTNGDTEVSGQLHAPAALSPELRALPLIPI